MQNSEYIFVLCLSAVSSDFGLVSAMAELRLSIYYFQYLIEFMLFSARALNCLSGKFDTIVHHLSLRFVIES